MFRVDTARAAIALPAPAAPGAPGYFQNGDTGTGLLATIPGADWFNMTQEELCNVVVAAGLVLSKTTYNQFLTALRILFGGNVSTVTASGALTAAQAGLILVDATAGNVAVALPAANAQAALKYRFVRIDASANSVTVTAAGADHIDQVTNFSLAGQNAQRLIETDGVSVWRTSGGQPGTSTVAGVLRLATIAEATAGASNAVAVTPAQLAAAVQTLAFARNRILNASMEIDQENEGTAVTATGKYIVDGTRQALTLTNSGAISSQRVADAPPGFKNSVKVTVSVQATATAAGDFLQVIHPIEGNNVVDLAFGNAAAPPVSLSFWVKSSLTGIFPVTLMNAANNRSYISSYTIAAANTWQKVTIPNIPGDVTGTWAVDNTAGILVIHGLVAGSTFQGTAGAWAAGNVFGLAAQAQLYRTAAATWQVTGVQLEPGAACNLFERRLFSAELESCQRYYEKSYDVGTAPGTATGVGSRSFTTAVATAAGIAYLHEWMFKVTKRTAPTAVLYDYTAGTSGSITIAGVPRAAVASTTSNKNIANFTNNSGVTWPTAGAGGGHFTADSRL